MYVRTRRRLKPFEVELYQAVPSFCFKVKLSYLSISVSFQLKADR